jgi:hypothetical protein
MESQIDRQNVERTNAVRLGLVAQYRRDVRPKIAELRTISLPGKYRLKRNVRVETWVYMKNFPLRTA